MNKNDLKKLIPLINSEDWDLLMVYISERIENNLNTLEKSSDQIALFKSQGAISELRNLRSLKHTIIRVQTEE